MNNGICGAASIMLLIGGTHVCAADSAGVSDAMRNCMAEKNDARRLACYDNAMSRLATAKIQEFGLQEKSTPRDHDTPDDVTATVVDIQTPSGGLFVFRLDNGQSWGQQQSVDYFPVKIGDKVTITRGVFGSFSMVGSATGHRTIAVKRLK